MSVTLETLLARVDDLLAVLTNQAAAARSPWMTPEETCLYLRWVNADGSPDKKAFYRARKRYDLPATPIAGALRCRKDRIDEWIRGVTTAADIALLRQRAAR
jgi:hypothetical protein